MGWMTGFEPATSGSTIRRSNQLSYTHHQICVWQEVRILSEALRGRKPIPVMDSIPGCPTWDKPICEEVFRLLEHSPPPRRLSVDRI